MGGFKLALAYSIVASALAFNTIFETVNNDVPHRHVTRVWYVPNSVPNVPMPGIIPQVIPLSNVPQISGLRRVMPNIGAEIAQMVHENALYNFANPILGSNVVDLNARRKAEAKDQIETSTEKDKSEEEKASPEVNQPEEENTRRKNTEAAKNDESKNVSDKEKLEVASKEKSDEVSKEKSNEDKDTDSKKNEKSVDVLPPVDEIENSEAMDESETPKVTEPENEDGEILPEVPKARSKRDVHDDTNPELIETTTTDDSLIANEEKIESTTEEIGKDSVKDIAPLLEASFPLVAAAKEVQVQPIEEQTENDEKRSVADDVTKVPITEATELEIKEPDFIVTPSELLPVSVKVELKPFVVPDVHRLKRQVDYTNSLNAGTVYQAPAYNQVSNEHVFHRSQEYNQVTSRQTPSLATPAYNPYTENHTPYPDHGNYQDLSGRYLYNYNPQYTQLRNYSPDNVQVGYRPTSPVYIPSDPWYYWVQTNRIIVPKEEGYEKIASKEKVSAKIKEIVNGTIGQVTEKDRKSVVTERIEEYINSEEDDGENRIIRLLKLKKQPRKVITIKIKESAERYPDDEPSAEDIKSTELNITKGEEKSSKAHSKCNENENSHKSEVGEESSKSTQEHNIRPRDADRSPLYDDDAPSSNKVNSEHNLQKRKDCHLSNLDNNSPSENKHRKNGHHKVQSFPETFEYEEDREKQYNEEKYHEHNLQHQGQIYNEHPTNGNEHGNEYYLPKQSQSSVGSRHAFHEHDHEMGHELNLQLQPDDKLLTRNSLPNVEQQDQTLEIKDRAVFPPSRYRYRHRRRPYRRRHSYDDIYSPYLDDYEYPYHNYDYLLRNGETSADKEIITPKDSKDIPNTLPNDNFESSNEYDLPKVNKPFENNKNIITEPLAQKDVKAEPGLGLRYLPYYMRHIDDLESPYISDDYDQPYHYENNLYDEYAGDGQNATHDDQNLISRSGRTIVDDNDSNSNEYLLTDEHNILNIKNSARDKRHGEVQSRHGAWWPYYYPYDYDIPFDYYSRSGTKSKRHISIDEHDKEAEKYHPLKNDYEHYKNVDVSDKDLLTDEIHGHNLNVKGRNGIPTRVKRQVNAHENINGFKSSTVPHNRIRRNDQSPHQYPSYHSPEYTAPNRPEYRQRTPSNLDGRKLYRSSSPRKLSSKSTEEISRYGYPYPYPSYPYYPYYPYYSRASSDDDRLKYWYNNEDDFHYGVARSGNNKVPHESNERNCLHRNKRLPHEIEGRAGLSEELKPDKDTRHDEEHRTKPENIHSTGNDQNKSVDSSKESKEKPESRADFFRYSFMESSSPDVIDLSFVKTLKDLQNVCLSLEFVRLICSAMTEATTPKDLDSLRSKLIRILDDDNPSWQPDNVKIPSRLKQPKARPTYRFYTQGNQIAYFENIHQTPNTKGEIFRPEGLDLGRPNNVVSKHKDDLFNANSIPVNLHETLRPDASNPYIALEEEQRPGPEKFRPSLEYYPEIYVRPNLPQGGLEIVPVGDIEHQSDYYIMPDNVKSYIPKQQDGYLPPFYPFYTNGTNPLPSFDGNLPLVNGLDNFQFYPDLPTSVSQNEPELRPNVPKPSNKPKYSQLLKNPEVKITDQQPQKNRLQFSANPLSPVTVDESIPDQYKGLPNKYPPVKPYSYLPKRLHHDLLSESQGLLKGRPISPYNKRLLDKDYDIPENYISDPILTNGLPLTNKPKYLPMISDYSPKNKVPHKLPETPHYLPEGPNILRELSPSKPRHLPKVPEYNNQPKVLDKFPNLPDGSQSDRDQLPNIPVQLQELPNYYYLPEVPNLPNKPSALANKPNQLFGTNNLPMMPDYLPNIPGTAPNDPGQLPKIPESQLPKIQKPEKPYYFPNGADSLPGQMIDVQKYSPNTPDYLLNSPVELPNIPQQLPGTPDYFTNDPRVPKKLIVLPSIPGDSQIGPGYLANVPDVSPNKPNILTYKHQNLPHRPQSPNAPQMFPEIPAYSAKAPQQTPEISGNLPKIPGTLPEKSYLLPQPIDNLRPPYDISPQNLDHNRPHRPSDLPKGHERPEQPNLIPKYDQKRPYLGPLFDQSRPDYQTIPELTLDPNLRPYLPPDQRPKKPFKHDQLEKPYSDHIPYRPYQDQTPIRPGSNQRPYSDHIPQIPDSYKPQWQKLEYIFKRPDFDHIPYPDHIPPRPHYVRGDQKYFRRTSSERYQDEENMVPINYNHFYLPQTDVPNKKKYRPDFNPDRPEHGFLKHPNERPHGARPCKGGKCHSKYHLQQRPSGHYLPPAKHEPYGVRPNLPQYSSEENLQYFPYDLITNGNKEPRPIDYSQTPERFFDLPQRPNKRPFLTDSGKIKPFYEETPSNVGSYLPFGENGKKLALESTYLPDGQDDYPYSGEYEIPYIPQGASSGKLPAYRGPVSTDFRPKGKLFPLSNKYPISTYSPKGPRLKQALTKFNEDLVKLQKDVGTVEGGVIKAFVYMVQDKKIEVLNDGKHVPIFDTNIPTDQKDAIAQYGHIYDLTALLPTQKGIPLVYETLPHMLNDILPPKKSYVSPSTHQWLSKIPFYRDNFVPIFVCDCDRGQFMRPGFSKSIGISSQVSTGPSFFSTSFGISKGRNVDSSDKDRVEIQDLEDNEQLLLRRKMPEIANENLIERNERNETVDQKDSSMYENNGTISNENALEPGDTSTFEKNKVDPDEAALESDESTQVPNTSETVSNSNEPEKTTLSEELVLSKSAYPKVDGDYETDSSVIEIEPEEFRRNSAHPNSNDQAFTNDIENENARVNELSKSESFGYPVERNAPNEDNVSTLDENVEASMEEVNEGLKLKESWSGNENDYDSISDEISSDEMAKYLYSDKPISIENTQSAGGLAQYSENNNVIAVKESGEVDENSVNKIAEANNHEAFTIKVIGDSDHKELNTSNEDDGKISEIINIADETISEDDVDKERKLFSLEIPNGPDGDIINIDNSDNNSSDSGIDEISLNGNDSYHNNDDDGNNNTKVDDIEETVTLDSDAGENEYDLLIVDDKESEKHKFEDAVIDSKEISYKIEDIGLDPNEKFGNFDEGVKKIDGNVGNSDETDNEKLSKSNEINKKSEGSDLDSDEKVADFAEELVNYVENVANSDEKSANSVKKVLSSKEKVADSDEIVLNSDENFTTPIDTTIEDTTPSTDQVSDESSDEVHKKNGKSAIIAISPHPEKSRRSILTHKPTAYTSIVTRILPFKN